MFYDEDENLLKRKHVYLSQSKTFWNFCSILINNWVHSIGKRGHFFVEQFTKSYSPEVNHQGLLGRVEKVLTREWTKVIADVRVQVQEDSYTYLRHLLTINNMYSLVLRVREHGSVRRILELDSTTLTILKRTHTGWSFFSSFANSDCLVTALIKNIAAEGGTNPDSRQILESKLEILLYILGRPVRPWGVKMPDVAMEMYNIACCALVLLERMEQAVSLWTVCAFFVLKEISHVDMGYMLARMMKQTLKLLKYRKQEDYLRLFMQIFKMTELGDNNGFWSGLRIRDIFFNFGITITD